MWRYLVGGIAALLMAAAGMVLFGRHAGVGASLLPPQPLAQAGSVGGAADDPLPASVPEASERTREQKRFDRYDKDRDGSVTRPEYLASRHKAFAKLDSNGDGQLSFDEWAAKTEGKFAGADKDRSGSLTPAEFASTAVKRKAGPRRTPCAAPSPVPARETDEEG